MKSCHNCNAIYADEYNGTCTDCGAGMAGQTGDAQALRTQWARQVSSAGREGNNPRSVNPEAGLINTIRERYCMPEGNQ